MQDNGVSHAAVETFPITNENKTIRKFGGEIEEKISRNKGGREKARKKIVKKFLNLKWIKYDKVKYLKKSKNLIYKIFQDLLIFYAIINKK